METVLPKSIRRANNFNDNNIFHYQKVHFGNWRQWGRYLVAESSRPATVSAAPISNKSKIKPIELFDIPIQLDSGDAEKEKNMNEETEKQPVKESNQTRQLQDLQSLHTTWLKQPQDERLEDFADLRALTDEIVEAVGGKQKDKCVRRRFLNWLDEVIHGHFDKKVEETYRREREEGHQLYPSRIIHWKLLSSISFSIFSTDAVLYKHANVLIRSLLLCYSQLLLHLSNDESSARAPKEANVASP